MNRRLAVSFGLVVSVALLFGAVSPRQARADEVLLSAPSANYRYYGEYSPATPNNAASFTLTASDQISTIDVTLRTPAGSTVNTFDFSLVDSLTSPTHVYASAALTAAVGTISTRSLTVNTTLPAGTYYLTCYVPGYFGTTVTPGDVDGWAMSTGAYTNTAGTVTNGVWANQSSVWPLISGNYYGNGIIYYAPAFTVHGTPVPTPEPAALSLLALATPALLLRRRRR